MHTVHTHQELLCSLARNGDPSAFYTLVAQFANAAYIAERNLGKSHKEALLVLIPFMKKAYQNFVTTIHQSPFDVWYRDYKRKYFHATLERTSPSPPPTDTGIESIPMADIAHFGAMLDLVLQRQYGKFRRTKKSRIVRRLSMQFIQLHWIMKITFIVALLVVAAIVALCVLSLSKNQLIVTYLAKGSPHSIVFPVPGNDANGLFHTISTALDSSGREKIHDTIAIHDTIRTGPRNYQGSQLHGYGFSGPAGASNRTASEAPASQAPSVQSAPGFQSGLKSAPTLKNLSPMPAPAKTTVNPTPVPVKSAYDSLQ